MEFLKFLDVSDAELSSACRRNYRAYRDAPSPSNAHRLLLFYAVECGLKAKLLSNAGYPSTAESPDIKKIGHNLNKLLDKVGAGLSFGPGSGISVVPDSHDRSGHHTQNSDDRRCLRSHDIHQAWRYGCAASDPSDSELERQLLDIMDWIRQNLPLSL